MSDIEDRADDYERRVVEAGGSDALIGGLVKGLRRQTLIVRWLVVVTAALVVMVGVLGFALWRIDSNSDNIGVVQDRTSNKVLCPLYSVFLASVDNAPPQAADSDLDGTVTAVEQERYDHAVTVIRDGYTTLECRPLLLVDEGATHD